MAVTRPKISNISKIFHTFSLENALDFLPVLVRWSFPCRQPLYSEHMHQRNSFLPCSLSAFKNLSRFQINASWKYQILGRKAAFAHNSTPRIPGGIFLNWHPPSQGQYIYYESAEPRLHKLLHMKFTKPSPSLPYPSSSIAQVSITITCNCFCFRLWFAICAHAL